MMSRKEPGVSPNRVTKQLLDQTTMGTFKEVILIEAPIESVWDTLADIGTIHRWNPGVVHSEQTTPGAVAVGARRHCDLGGTNFLHEEVVGFEPQHALTIRITDTNLPFKTADIRFRLEIKGKVTLVEVSPLYQLNYGLVGRLLDLAMVRHQYQKGMQGLLQGLKAYVEQHASDSLA